MYWKVKNKFFEITIKATVTNLRLPETRKPSQVSGMLQTHFHSVVAQNGTREKEHESKESSEKTTL